MHNHIKNIVFTGVVSLLLFACKGGEEKAMNNNNSSKTEITEVIKDNYELDKPLDTIKAVLVLFGGYGENGAGVKTEFKIQEPAKMNRVAVLYMNFNRKLWLEEAEKESLAKELSEIFKDNRLPVNNIYLGGLSSGGDVAMLMSNYLVENTNYGLAPKGAFIVDSPIDLLELYHSAEVNVENDFEENVVAESAWLINTFNEEFGRPENGISAYEKYSVATLKTGNIQNIKALKNTKIRFYTEPDTTWWKKNTNADYETLNASHIKRLADTLKQRGYKYVTYIETKNRGFRANGERHPHSWSIVDHEGLLNWMLKE